MSASPLVTVLLPVWNGASLPLTAEGEEPLRVAIRSLARQEAAPDAPVPGFEVLAVDDGSTDGTAALLEQLAEESAELAQAALKMARKIRNENPTPKSHADCVANLQEEIADVELCISVLPAALHDPAEVGRTMAAKHRRWNERLHDEKLWEVSNHED